MDLPFLANCFLESPFGAIATTDDGCLRRISVSLCECIPAQVQRDAMARARRTKRVQVDTVQCANSVHTQCLIAMLMHCTLAGANMYVRWSCRSYHFPVGTLRLSSSNQLRITQMLSKCGAGSSRVFVIRNRCPSGCI